MELSNSLEELAAGGGVGDSQSDEHESDFLASLCQVAQPAKRLRRITKALDAVLAAVAPEELCLDVGEGVTIVVDCEEKGKRHSEVPSPYRVAVSDLVLVGGEPEVAVEGAARRRVPRDLPPHSLSVGLDILDRRQRGLCEGGVAGVQMGGVRDLVVACRVSIADRCDGFRDRRTTRTSSAGWAERSKKNSEAIVPSL